MMGFIFIALFVCLMHVISKGALERIKANDNKITIKERKRKNMSKNKITINGNTYEASGKNIVAMDNAVFVDGKKIEGSLQGDIHITFEGDLASLHTKGSATVNGDIKDSVDANGSVEIIGNVGGSVKSGGSVKCRNVNGGVTAGGSISCK